MATIVGTGDFKYRIVEDWAKLPDGWSFKEVGAVGVDSNDNVYVFNRGDHPMMVFDRDGNFLRSWGEGQYPRAHGVHMGPDESIYLTDDGGHFVRKCRLEDGKVLLELGVPGKPAEYMSGEPFHRCTHTALAPNGDIYVSDGYGNARVHKYSPDGKLLMSWGEPGTDPGQFNIVHNICTDADGWVYVADRENHRVQVFDGNGKYESQWNNADEAAPLAEADLVAARRGLERVDVAARVDQHLGVALEQGDGVVGVGRHGGSANGCRASATRMPAPPRRRFSGRMAWPSTPAAISMSARSRGRSGRNSLTRRGRPISARCRNTKRCIKAAGLERARRRARAP